MNETSTASVPRVSSEDIFQGGHYKLFHVHIKLSHLKLTQVHKNGKSTFSEDTEELENFRTVPALVQCLWVSVALDDKQGKDSVTKFYYLDTVNFLLKALIHEILSIMSSRKSPILKSSVSALF